jgi:hypothetical protein
MFNMLPDNTDPLTAITRKREAFADIAAERRGKLLVVERHRVIHAPLNAIGRGQWRHGRSNV